MADYFIGEIRPFCFDYPPQGFVRCNGTILQVQLYPALFSVIGSIYGGNGQTTFAIPNIQSRVLVGTGILPTTGTSYMLNQTGGATGVTLNYTQMPNHNHAFNAASAGPPATGFGAETNLPGVAPNPLSLLSNVIGKTAGVSSAVQGGLAYTHTTPVNAQLGANSVLPVGSGQAHSNQSPYVVINYCICVIDGEYPARN